MVAVSRGELSYLYPLIGLSGTPLKNLDRELLEFFASGNARYFVKDPFDQVGFRSQVAYNIGYNRGLYQNI
ncbi:MAG: hypothetical protein GW780_05310 [Candidatus Aenigmarchaeota archaeon]|nr:hypothetical protein [Candidatus Aenigmarchaeota archaeon]